MASNSYGARNRVRSRWECINERHTEPEPISPELVLVDPELARRVRPLGDSKEARGRRASTEAVAAVPGPQRDAHPTRLRVVAGSVAVVAAIALVTIATAAVPRSDDRPYLDASSPVGVATTSAAPSPTVPRSSLEDPEPTRSATAPAASTVKPRPGTPPAGASRAERVELRWEPVPKAAYYNVILWRDGRRLRDYWPRQPRLVIRIRTLDPLGGRTASAIHWFVYPVEVEAGRSRIGPVRATGSITVPPR